MITPSMWSSRNGCAAESPGSSDRNSQMDSVHRLRRSYKRPDRRSWIRSAFGVVVVAIRGHEESSPELVEHELLFGGVQRGSVDCVPGGVDVLPCPALGDEGGHFHAFVFAREAWKQGERGSGVVGEMTIDGLFDRWIIRACLLMQTGLRGWMRGHVNGLQTAISVGPVFAEWR